MASSELGELLVHFRGENSDLEKKVAALEKSLKDAERTSDRSAAKVVGSLTRMAAGFVTVTAVVSAFTKAMEDTRAMDRLATATGTPIEALSSLRTVAQQNGVTFQELEQVLSQFSNRLRETLASPTSAGAQALRLLGVSARDANGDLRTLEDMLPELADKFASYTDGANKASISTALFGEQGGPGMVRFLNQGSGAIAAQRAVLEATGQVMTREGIERSREYERVTAQLSSSLSSVARELSMAVAPALSAVGEIFNELVKRSLHTHLIGKGLGELGVELANLLKRQGEIRTDLEAMKNMGSGILRDVILGPRHAALTLELAAVDQKIANIEARMTKLSAPEMDDPTRLLMQQAPNLGAQQEAVRLINEQLQITQDKLNGLPVAFQLAFGDTGAWAPAYLDALAQINRATELGAITAQRAGQMRVQIQRSEQDAILNTLSAASTAITAAFAKNKAAGIAAAIINTGVGVTRALASGPPPWNFAQAALVAAAGAAQIASIASTNQNGGGGAASVSGGSASESSAPQEAAPSRSLFVQGIDPAALYSGGMLEQLIAAINTEVGNGATLISTRNIRM